MAGLEPALYHVTARAPTYVFPYYDLTNRPSCYRIGDSVTITLVKGGVITGTVTSASGEPLVQIAVQGVLIQDQNGQKFGVNRGVAFTDDRGVYRIYGLLPGTYLVSAGGLSSFYSSGEGTAFDTDIPTFAPSSTRDTAVEVTVRGGEETSGVDIRHRAEPGHVVSGTVDKPKDPNGTYPAAGVTLTQISNVIGFQSLGRQQVNQLPGSSGFLFPNVADGDYIVTAGSETQPGSGAAMSEPRRITVKGADVTGLDMVTRPLGSISGRLVLENSTAPECKGKRRPLFGETLILAKNSSRESVSDELQRQLYYFREVIPDKAGNFSFKYLVASQYGFDLQFFAKYWYLQAITYLAPPAETAPGKSKPTAKPVDAASNWISLKSGERLTGLSIVLAEGAASLLGKVTPAEGERLPGKILVHLVPAEPDKAEEVLRFYTGTVGEDGSFAVGNVAPGRYWVIARVTSEPNSLDPSNLKRPDQIEIRRKLRREAETSNHLIELTDCQNLTNVKLKI